MLPETLGSKLPETIKDVSELSKSSEASNQPPEETKTEVKIPPTAKITPIQRPQAFVVPSIIIDPGTPKSPFKKAKPEIQIPEIQIQESTPPKLDLNSVEERSRRFSKLPPAPSNSPNAVKMGKFGVIPTPDKIVKETSMPENIVEEVEVNPMPEKTVKEASLTPTSSEKSRRFSKLPPANVDSPNAVKLSSKFTMIPQE